MPARRHDETARSVHLPDVAPREYGAIARTFSPAQFFPKRFICVAPPSLFRDFQTGSRACNAE
jgi:hypothetical protein